MAMSSLSDEDDFNPEINTTPLVDVMLLLLISFIITIPVMDHAIKLDLPHAAPASQTRSSRKLSACRSTLTAKCSGTAS